MCSNPIGILHVSRKSVPGIGTFPADWKIGFFSDIVTPVSRAIPKPKDSYWRLGLRSFSRGTFHELIAEPEKVDMEELYRVEKNDLIVNITFAWEHAIAVAQDEDAGLLVSFRFPTYTFTSIANPDFYKYIISQNWLRKQLDLISPGGAGRNRVMNKTQFLKIPCPIPPLEEQQRIAEILECCDKVIRLKRELLVEKRKQKKSLMQKLLNPDSGFRLPGFKEEWESQRLGILCETFSGGTPSRNCNEYFNGNIPWLKSGELNNRIITQTEERITQSALDSSSAKMVKSGTLLLALYGATAGIIAITKIDVAISQAILAIENTDMLDTQYLYFALLNQIDIAKNKYTQGGQPNFNAGIIQALVINYPKQEEQEAIAKILSAVDREIDLLEEDLSQWEQKKKSLMQHLLTGKVRVFA